MSYLDQDYSNLEIYRAYGDRPLAPGATSYSDNVVVGLDYRKNWLYGDDSTGHLLDGGNDNVTGGDYSINEIYGDFQHHPTGRYSDNRLLGGDDVLVGGDCSINNIRGDFIFSSGYDVAGNDTIYGGDQSYNILGGDTTSWTNGVLGDDVIYGGSSSFNIIYGDGNLVHSTNLGHPEAGDDVLFGGDFSENYIYGDGKTIDIRGGRVSGDDMITGGANSTNYLYGDARLAEFISQTGDDLIIAGDNSVNYMYGDAEVFEITFLQLIYNAPYTTGSDTLVSGTGEDHMWGDYSSGLVTGGADTFVFHENNGSDTIYDFERGKDVIDFSNLPLTHGPMPQEVLENLPQKAIDALIRSGQLTTSEGVLDSNGDGLVNANDDFVATVQGNLIIDLGAALGGNSGLDTLTILGVDELGVNDFLL
jgi:Ca2+-binding RTX toxin-like protein